MQKIYTRISSQKRSKEQLLLVYGTQVMDNWFHIHITDELIFVPGSKCVVTHLLFWIQVTLLGILRYVWNEVILILPFQLVTWAKMVLTSGKQTCGLSCMLMVTVSGVSFIVCNRGVKDSGLDLDTILYRYNPHAYNSCFNKMSYFDPSDY